MMIMMKMMVVVIMMMMVRMIMLGDMLMMREIKHQNHLLYLSIYTSLLYLAELNYLHNDRM